MTLVNIKRWNTHFAGAELERGKQALEAGDPAQAIPHLRQSIQLDPTQAEAYLLLGRAHRATERRDEALRAFEKAIETAPGSAAGFLELGGVLLDLGETAKAMDALRQAVALDPGNSEARERLHELLGAGADEDGVLDGSS